MSLRVLVLPEDADPLADGLGSVLVVAGDHDDPDAGLLAAGNRRLHFQPRGVQHTGHSDKGQVGLVLDELGGVLQVHVLGTHGGVGGGEGQAPEGDRMWSKMLSYTSRLLRLGFLQVLNCL